MGGTFIVCLQKRFSSVPFQPASIVGFVGGKDGEIKLRLSNDNRSVAKAIIHFPLQKLLTFCSIFTNLLSPQNFSQALDATCQMPAIGAEWKVKQLRGRLLCGRRMQIGRLEGLEQFFISGMDA